MAAFLNKPVPHEEARRFIEAKPAVQRAVFDRMLPEIRARAFTITGIESAEILRSARDRIPEILRSARDRIADLPAGGDWDAIKRDVANMISPWTADSDDPDTRDKSLRQGMRRAEVLLRQHGYQAYQATQHEVLQEVVEDFPYWQYVTVGDADVRDSHAALDGLVLPANHEFWSRHYPPWEWGCRCQVVPISKRDYERIQKGRGRGRVLSKGQERVLIKRGQLDDGAGHMQDVRAPVDRETTTEGKRKAYQWSPGDLRLPMEDLKERYDGPTWAAFERWSKKTQVGDVSLHDWLRGAPILRTSVMGRANPLSRRAVVDPGKPLSQPVRRALEDMDRVADGAPGELAVDFTPVKGAYGRYVNGRISVNQKSPWPRMTLAHEAGHYLQEKALGNVDLSGVWKAIDETDTVKRIRMSGLSQRKKDYFLNRKETFARAYAQYMAERVDSRAWKEDIALMGTSKESIRVWGKKDFAPVRAALEAALRKAGLI